MNKILNKFKRTALNQVRSRSVGLKSLKKQALRLARLEAGLALNLAYRFMHDQVKIRPRIGLFVKVLVILAITFLATSQAVAYFKPKEAEIKINGQPILIAEAADDKAQGEVEISTDIVSRRSPFEFQKPVSGYISQGYRSYHRALDITGNFNEPIKPLGAGVVEFTGFLADGKGNVVVVDHGDGLKSLYAHMNRIEVGVGNVINTNSTVGTVGLTGRTTGPHVHLEIYDNNVQVDPASVLPQ